MAREIGVFDMPANFEGAKAAPLDARQVCGTVADREALTYTYHGMICVITDDPVPSYNGVWVMNKQIGATQASVDDDWDPIGGGSGDPVVAFDYFPTEADITTAIQNDTDAASKTVELIDLSAHNVDVAANELKITSAFINGEYIDFSSDFNGKYILSADGELLKCSAEYDEVTWCTEVTFDGTIDPATDFANPFAVTSTQLELNDLVITLDSGSTFKVNIQGGSGGGVYDPDNSNLEGPVALTATMPEKVGGIPAGTSAQDLHEMEFSDVWNKLLFPALGPQVNPPGGSLQDVTGVYKEVGTSHTFTWKPDFGLGSIVIKDSSGAVIENQGAASYGLNSATFQFPGGTPFNIHDGADGLTGPVVHNGYTIVYGNQPDGWTYTYDFQDGKMPKDSAGTDVPDDQLTAVDAPHAAGSINHNVFGTYPVYLGTISGPPGNRTAGFEPINNRSQNTTDTNSNAHGGLTGANGSLFISQKVGEDGVRHRVAIPAVFGNATFQIVNPSGNGSSYNSYGDFVNIGQRTDLHPSGIAYDVYENQAASESGGDPSVNNAIRQKYKVSF